MAFRVVQSKQPGIPAPRERAAQSRSPSLWKNDFQNHCPYITGQPPDRFPAAAQLIQLLSLELKEMTQDHLHPSSKSKICFKASNSVFLHYLEVPRATISRWSEGRSHCDPSSSFQAVPQQTLALF